MRRHGLRRALFVQDAAEGLSCSSPALEPVRRALLENHRDFDRHAAVFLEIGEQTGALLAAFIHRAERGQASGGVRHWKYETVLELLNDGLRLSRGMTRKNALAGLFWGGGKGVIAANSDELEDATERAKLFIDYGHFVSSLRGAYITAEDVGITAADMAHIHRATRFATCVPTQVGGSGNPSGATARGVLSAMETALSFLGTPSLQHQRLAVQGAGNVSRFMLAELLQRGAAQIVVHDVSERACEMTRAAYPDERVKLKRVDATDDSIFDEPCDVFAPNALGGILHHDTIHRLRARLVCGSANNPLLDDTKDDLLLESRGILHVPDFIANRMGIVQCANEQYGWFADDPAILRHFDPSYEASIPVVTRQVLERAQRERTTPTRAANALADERSATPHPLWPQRTRDILTSLLANRWAQC